MSTTNGWLFWVRALEVSIQCDVVQGTHALKATQSGVAAISGSTGTFGYTIALALHAKAPCCVRGCLWTRVALALPDSHKLVLVVDSKAPDPLGEPFRRVPLSIGHEDSQELTQS